MMEIPKVLNLYSKDKLRDRKSEDVVQKYMSSFYLHVLGKALCMPCLCKGHIFSCRPKAHLKFLHMFCAFSFNVRQLRFLQTSCMSKRSSYFPRTCPICAHATYRTQRNFSADLPLCLPVLYVAGHGGRLAPLAAKHQTSLFSHFLSPDCCSGCSQRGVVQD